jgi:CRISPR-associated protein Csd2
MTARALIVFKHDSDLGNAPAHKLLERVRVKRVPNRADSNGPPRGFDDYTVMVDKADLSCGITIETKI